MVIIISIILLQIARLAVIGGKSLKDVIAGLLRQLLTVQMQRHYNWYGQKGKLKSGSLKLAALVCSKYIHSVYTLLFPHPFLDVDGCFWIVSTCVKLCKNALHCYVCISYLYMYLLPSLIPRGNLPEHAEEKSPIWRTA